MPSRSKSGGTTSAVPQLAPLPEILAAPLSRNELSSELRRHAANVKFLNEFEEGWKEYLLTLNKDNLPKGDTGERIESLMQKIHKIENSKEGVELELKEQLSFFQASRLRMEEKYDQKLRKATQEQRFLHQKLLESLATAKKAEKVQKETLPWFHFISEINHIAAGMEQDEEEEKKTQEEEVKADDATHETQSTLWSVTRSIKPSARAILLAQDESIQTRRDDETALDADLRAYRVDNALLTAHTQILKKEIERMEHLVLTREYVAKFLTANDFSSTPVALSSPHYHHAEESPAASTSLHANGTF